MDLSKQIQTAGENSTQVIVGTMNVLGVTDERAREICREEFAILAGEMTEEAVNIAKERVGQLADKLLPKMASYDEQLSAFADPSFQLALRKAQKSAACTDSESDYDLLSELLVERAKTKDDKSRQLGVTKALEIVGQVSDEALLGLATSYVAVRLKPTADNLTQALQVYNQVFAKIIGEQKLPEEGRWVEDLNILMAVRINNLGIRQSQDFFSGKFEEQLVVGVEKGCDAYVRIQNDLQSVGLPVDAILVPHPLKPNYVKFASAQDVKDLSYMQNVGGRLIKINFTDQQREVLQRVADELRKSEASLPKMQVAFMQEGDKYPYLKMVRQWWDSLDSAPILTPVGEALANAYSRTKDSSIPKLK